MSGFLNYPLLCALFLKLDTVSNPAELHGCLCGKLAAGQRLSHPEWQAFVMEFMDVQGEVNPAVAEALNGLYDQSLTQFTDEELGFRLLLPDEDTDIAERLAALAQWCSGFLNGLGTSRLEASRLGESGREALSDLAAIAQVDTNQVAGEEAEQEFLAVSEYVRVAALTILAEAGPAPGDAAVPLSH